MDVNGIGGTGGVPMYDTPLPATQAAPAAPAAPVKPGGSSSATIQHNTTANLSQNESKALAAVNAENLEKQSENPTNKEALEKTISQINKAITGFDREMHVSVHEKTQRIMVKVMDTVENKVIREIPPEKVLDAFARTLELAGILIDTRS